MVVVRVAIAGGNGFIGRELTGQLLTSGHEVVWLSHKPGSRPAPEGVREVEFDATNSAGEWVGEIAAADGVVNLSGYPISSYWTEGRKELLRTSRIGTTKALVRAIADARVNGPRPRVLVNASACGVYGDARERLLTEGSPLGDDFLAAIVVDWEDAAHCAEDYDCRVVTIRNGIALGSEGVLPRMTLPARLFVGGPIGNGRQWVSWVHVTDLAGLYKFALEHDEVSGPMNGGAPNPVRMTDLSAELGHTLGRPSWLRVPAFALEVIIGDVAPYTLMSQQMSAEKALAAGYVFQFPELSGALADLVGSKSVTHASAAGDAA